MVHERLRRFLLRRVSGGYTVSGGEKLAEYDYGADDWELATFTNLMTATSTSDYDGDDFLDWEEYVAGTSATNSDSFLRLTDLIVQTGFVFSWPSATGRVYSVYWSSNLLSGFEPFATNIDPTPPLNTYTDTWHIASTAGFYRVWLRKL